MSRGDTERQRKSQDENQVGCSQNQAGSKGREKQVRETKGKEKGEAHSKETLEVDASGAQRSVEVVQRVLDRVILRNQVNNPAVPKVKPVVSKHPKL